MLLQVQVWSMLLLQEAEVGWDPRSLWHQMGSLAKVVVVGLFFMSAWSIGVMIDRLMAYNAARKQSRTFAPAVAGVSEQLAHVLEDNFEVDVPEARMGGPRAGAETLRPFSIAILCIAGPPSGMSAMGRGFS